MKKLIKQYLKLCIETKKGLKKEIQRLDDVTKQLYELVADINVLVEEYEKTSYKSKYLAEHKKLKDLEKEAKDIIDNLTEELKLAEKNK